MQSNPLEILLLMEQYEICKLISSFNYNMKSKKSAEVPPDFQKITYLRNQRASKSTKCTFNG